MFERRLIDKAKLLVDFATNSGIKVGIVESCTGGMLSTLITEVPHASNVLERAIVTYSNQAKIDLVGVSANILDGYGAVSSQVAEEMVKGLVRSSTVNVAVSITGIAGPDGGTVLKPVGLVYTALYSRMGDLKFIEHNFFGDRTAIRLQATEHALNMFLDYFELHV